MLGLARTSWAAGLAALRRHPVRSLSALILLAGLGMFQVTRTFPHDGTRASLTQSMLSLGSGILSNAVQAPLVIGLYRDLVLGESRDGVAIAIGYRDWRWIVRWWGVNLVVLVPLLVFLVPVVLLWHQHGTTARIAAVLLAAAGAAGILAFLMRYAFLSAGIALDDPAPAHASFQLAAGRKLRIFACGLLTTAPMSIVQLIEMFLPERHVISIGGIVWSLGDAAMDVIQAAVLAALLSMLYREYTADEAPGRAAAAAL